MVVRRLIVPLLAGILAPSGAVSASDVVSVRLASVGCHVSFGAPPVQVIGRDVLVTLAGDHVVGSDCGAALRFDVRTGALRQRFDDPAPNRFRGYAAATTVSGRCTSVWGIE